MRLERAFACAGALICAGAVSAAQPGQRSIDIESRQGAADIEGEVRAVVDRPFEVAVAALDKPSQWCDILMLHLDTKSCSLATEGGLPVLHVGIVRKYDQPVSAAHHVAFDYRLVTESPTLLLVKLDADSGPLGTSNYRIVFEASPTPDGRTLIHMSYSYSYGALARIAMQAYLATFGRNKVGFTVVGTERDGEPRYIGGMRGLVERNTMRYYLAVEAYLGALSSSREARLEKSLLRWHSAVEGYPRQLHEMERGEYLAMKRRELALY